VLPLYAVSNINTLGFWNQIINKNLQYL
jgi:hypothetical protein